MSEYQYYEFQAVDRPLDERQQGELRAISTRARITATRFVNHYEWGDLKADPLRLVERYFDLFLYVANWGSRRFAMRLPKRLVDAGDLERFRLDDEVARVHAAGHHLVVDISVEEIESEDWDDGSGWLAALAPLRAEVLNGDMRLFYIVWLMAVAKGWIADEAVEPLCGIAPLSASLRAFADFLGIDDGLLGIAAENSPAESGAGPSRAAVESFIRSLPEEEKVALLLRLHEGDDPNLAAGLRRRCRQSVTTAAAARKLRTAGELRAAAERLAEVDRRTRTEAAAAERRRQEEERAQARKRHLADLAKRGEAAWREVEDLIRLRNATGYDKATALLADLRDIAGGNRGAEAFQRRIADIRVRHARKGRLVARLDAAGLGRRPRPT